MSLLEAFRRAIRYAAQEKASAQGFANAAAILDASGAVHLAVKYLQAALERDPNHAYSLVHLGVCYIRNGQYVEAEKVKNKSILILTVTLTNPDVQTVWIGP